MLSKLHMGFLDKLRDLVMQKCILEIYVTNKQSSRILDYEHWAQS